MAQIKISELTPKGAPLSTTDLLLIAQETSDGFESRSITGAEIITTAQEGRQATLVSGTNIKTIEGQSLLGSGNIDLTKSDVGLSNVDNTSDLSKPISTATQTALNAKQPTLVSGTNIKTINGNSLLGSGDLTISGGGGLTIGTTAIASGTIGRILFEGTGNILQESANLFWDNTNSRLGINTALPNMALDIRTGNVGIGVTSDAGFKLDVNGTARVSGALTFNGGTGVTKTISEGSLYGLLIYGGTGSNADLTLTDRSGNLRFRIVNGGNILQTATTINDVLIGGISFASKSIYTSGQYGFVFGGSSGTSYNISLFESTGTNGLFIDSAGRAKVGAYNSTYNNSAILEAVSTTRGFLPPRMSTTQKNAIASAVPGLIVYDTTLNKLCVYTTTWETITSV